MMRVLGMVVIVIVLLATLPFQPTAVAFDVCGDCEDDDGNFSCGSALPCMGHIPGFYCKVGDATGKCNDIEHADCDDEPQEVCCGCNIFDWGGKKRSYEPAEAIPDGDPFGFSSTIVMDASIPFDFLDIGIEMDHTEMGDLVITLSHNGITVVLVDQPVCGVALSCDREFYLSDIGIGPVHCPLEECDVFFPGGEIAEDAAYVPLEPLDAFFGQDTAGEWTLNVADVTPGVAREPGGIGQICSWELMFAQEPASPADPPFTWGVIKALYR